MPVRTCSLIATTIYPSHSARYRSGLHRGEASGYTSPIFGRPGSFPPTTMPSAPLLSCVRGRLLFPQPIRLARDAPGRHERFPGVNTCLSVHECRVYGHTLRWIEDFALRCRLVPVCAPHTRFLFVIPYLRGTLPRQGSFFPKHRHQYSVGIPLRPSPPSGWA
jgi:hypothetical protein